MFNIQHILANSYIPTVTKVISSYKIGMKLAKKSSFQTGIRPQKLDFITPWSKRKNTIQHYIHFQQFTASNQTYDNVKVQKVERSHISEEQT